MRPFDYDRYGSAFVDMRLHRLRVLITEQSDELFRAKGIDASSATVSVLLLLKERGHASITQIADALGYSHQLINHRLKQLEKLELLQRFSDVRDKRKWLVKLTATGEAEADRVEKTLPEVAAQFDAMFAELDCALSDTLKSLHKTLSEKPLHERILKDDFRERA